MKNLMKKVSIIIPTFNREKYLDKALESLFDQTFRDFEIIIVDDGSEDGTKLVVEKYSKKYQGQVKYFYQSNRGPAAARNFAFKESNTKYLAFLDSDDIWSPNKLEQQIDFLEKNSDIGGIFSDYYIFNEKNEIVLKSFFKCIGLHKQLRKLIRKDECWVSSNLINFYIFKNFIHPSSLLVRSEVFKSAGGFDEELHYCEIWFTFFKLLLKTNLAFSDELLVGSRKHSSNTDCLMSSQKMMDFSICAIKKALKVPSSAKVKFGLLKKLSDHYYYRGYAVRELNRKQSFLSYLKAILIFPLNVKCWISVIRVVCPKNAMKRNIIT